MSHFTHVLNFPAELPTLADAAGNLTFALTNTVSYFAEGKLFPQVAAADFPSLTGNDVASNGSKLFTLYVRPVDGAVPVLEVATGVESANGSATDALIDFGKLAENDSKKGLLTVPYYQNNTTYVINQRVRFKTMVLEAVAGFTSGAEYDPADWTLLPPLTLQYEVRSILGFALVRNDSASDFIGGTTALNAANISTTYYPAFPYMAQ